MNYFLQLAGCPPVFRLLSILFMGKKSIISFLLEGPKGCNMFPFGSTRLFSTMQVDREVILEICEKF